MQTMNDGMRQEIAERVERMGARERGLTLRATRERVGWSQMDVALRYNVSVRSVKRWEQPIGQWCCPDEVLEGMLVKLARMVWSVCDMFKSGVPQTVTLPYWVTFEGWLADHPHDDNEFTSRDFGEAQARQRMVADYMEMHGGEVRWV